MYNPILLGMFLLLAAGTIIFLAIFTYARQRLGTTNQPLKNPFFEGIRVTGIKTGNVLSMLLGLGVIVAIVVVCVQAVWEDVTHRGWISHTERVMTDINPQWLNGEQNTCVYLRRPADEVAQLGCGLGETPRNIPIRFYGATVFDTPGVVRLEWKCTREGDTFSCSDGKPMPANK